MMLSDAFTKYLSNWGNLEIGKELVNELKSSGLLVESYLLNRYLKDDTNKWINIDNNMITWRNKRFFLSDKLPKDAIAGDIWFDIVELNAMILVQRNPEAVAEYSSEYLTKMTPFHSWIALKPVSRWQFKAFLNLAQVSPRKNQINPPINALDKNRLVSDEETLYQDNLTQDETRLYAFWFNKSVARIESWRYLKEQNPTEFHSLWQENSKEWLGQASDFNEAIRFAITEFDIDRDLDEDEDLQHGEFFFSPNLFFRTAVSTQFGLNKSQQHFWMTEFVNLNLDNAFLRSSMFNQPSQSSPWWVESDQGYFIKQTNRFEMTYKDAVKSVSFEIEPGETSITVFSKTIILAKTEQGTRELTDAEKVSLIQNLKAALESTGKSFEII